MWSLIASWRDRVEEYDKITDYRISPLSGESIMLLILEDHTVIYLRAWESLMFTKEDDHGTDTLR